MRDHLVQDAGNKNILLVEDSPITRAREKQILLGYRLNVFEASNGREALDLLSRQQIDWVITDIEMPVMNGIDLIKHMKGDRSLSRLPIIVVSSYETHMGNVYDLGITFFINKAEFTPQLFVNVLKKEKLIS
jgi:CheY-like chemotaxis protein